MTDNLFDYQAQAAAKCTGMTPDEIRIAKALAGCSFTPGTAVKRFCQQLGQRDTSKPMTEKGRDFMMRIAVSYRRQLPKDLVALAMEYTGGKGLK